MDTPPKSSAFELTGIVLFLAAISPIGAVAPMILLHSLHICTFNYLLGSGDSVGGCSIPVIGNLIYPYFQWIEGLFEVSLIFLIGILWAFIAFVIWAALILWLITLAISYLRNRNA